MFPLFATLGALAASAVAACVVPWFYCKSPDNADEAREDNGIIDATNLEPQSRSVNDHNSTSATSHRINNVNFVRLMAPPRLSTSFHSTGPTSTTQDSTILPPLGHANLVLTGARHLVQAFDVRSNNQPCGNTDAIISETINSRSIRMDGLNAESTRNCDVSEALASERNLRDFYQKLIDTATSELQLLDAGSVSATLMSVGTSNPTEGSATESGIRIFPSPPVLRSSNQTVESSAGAPMMISTSPRSENFSAGPTKVLTNEHVESPKIANVLETIAEVHDNEESITSPSTRPSNRIIVRSAPQNRSPPIIGSPDSTQFAFGQPQDVETKKTSRNGRSSVGFSGRLKKIWRGMKRNNHKLHKQPVSSLCAEIKIPSGHSTMISETQCHPETNPTRTSPKTLKVYEGTDISSINDRTCVMQRSGKHLDSSSHPPSETSDEEAGDAPACKNRRTRSAGPCRKILRGMTEYMNSKKRSKANVESGSISDSMMFRGEACKMCIRDDNRNVSLDCLNCVNVKTEETVCCGRGKKVDGSESGCLPKSNGFGRRIKKIFHIGKKDRNEENEILPSLRKGRVLNSAPVEFQRNSAGNAIFQRKEEICGKTVVTSDSPTDVSSYRDLGIASSDERYFDLPSTRLSFQ